MNNYKYFENRDCKYFPCHSSADRQHFNCMFCYCPLYMLGDKCGGNFKYNAKGVKDCSNCLLPHCEGGYERITGRLRAVVREMAAERTRLDGKNTSE